ncbi:MAG: type II secretion system F family protein [bacterium]|nr:type II secretion system F family protein [bacterium]
MFLCIAVAVVGVVILVMSVCNQKKKSYRIYACILLASGLLGSMMSVAEKKDADDSRVIERKDPGEGSISKDYLINVEGLLSDEPYRVVVENRHLTKVELEQLFESAIEEFEQQFLGNNQSFDEIRSNVCPVKSVLNGKVSVQISFDHYSAVNLEGQLLEEHLTESGTPVTVHAIFSYESVQVEHVCAMMVYPPEKTIQEQFLTVLNQRLQELNKKTDATLNLPEFVEGRAIEWKPKNKSDAHMILLLGMVTLILVLWGRKQDCRKQEVKRKDALMEQYPMMLDQLSLLLGAGMTMSGAWEKMVQNYERKCTAAELNDKPVPIYEEMKTTYYQMKDGMSERAAYEAFGNRLQLPVYQKFSALLLQNMRKGSVGLSKVLTQEMQEALAKQENTVKKQGEQLETRLLLPMMLMLFLVIVIILLPVLMTM